MLVQLYIQKFVQATAVQLSLSVDGVYVRLVLLAHLVRLLQTLLYTRDTVTDRDVTTCKSCTSNLPMNLRHVYIVPYV